MSDRDQSRSRGCHFGRPHAGKSNLNQPVPSAEDAAADAVRRAGINARIHHARRVRKWHGRKIKLFEHRGGLRRKARVQEKRRGSSLSPDALREPFRFAEVWWWCYFDHTFEKQICRSARI